MANSFYLNGDNFKVGEVVFEIDRKKSIITELTVEGDEKTFEKLSENEDGDWDWALYPPKFSLAEVPFKLKDDVITIKINEKLRETCDANFYMMEWSENLEGVLTIDKNNIMQFKGTTDVDGDDMKLEIEVDLKKVK